MPHNNKDLAKKRGELKKELAAIEKFEKQVTEAGENLRAELAAAEKEVNDVYKEESDKLNAAMMDDARSALKE